MKYYKTIRNTLSAGIIALSVPLCPKQCSTPVQPMKNRIVSTISDTIKHKKVLVIDCFSENALNIDRDIIGDISHGRIVSGIIENGLPEADVFQRNIEHSDLYNDNYMQTNIVKPLLKEMRNGQRYDAINLSMGAEMSFNDLSEKIGIDVNADNIANKAKTVKSLIRKNLSKFNSTGHSAMSLIDCMDSLSARGTKIYISAGNGGAEQFNWLALIDNSINVGSINKKGEIKKSSENHSLVNRFVRDFLPLNKTKNGYSINTGYGNINIDKKDCSGLFHITKRKGYDGTSFASPKALVEDLK